MDGEERLGADPTRPITRGNPPADTMFKPGYDPRRHTGRSSGLVSFRTLLQAKGAERDGKALRMAVDRLYTQARKGNIAAIKLIAEWNDGPLDTKTIIEIVAPDVVAAASRAAQEIEREFEIPDLFERWLERFTANLGSDSMSLSDSHEA